MIELSKGSPLPGADLCEDASLRALDAHCEEAAREFRAVGARLDQHPDAIDGLMQLPGVQFLQQALLPAGYRSQPPGVSPGLVDLAWSTPGLVILFERYAYGDPGIVLASPGPALSG